MNFPTAKDEAAHKRAVSVERKHRGYYQHALTAAMTPNELAQALLSEVAYQYGHGHKKIELKFTLDLHNFSRWLEGHKLVVTGRTPYSDDASAQFIKQELKRELQKLITAKNSLEVTVVASHQAQFDYKLSLQIFS